MQFSENTRTGGSRKIVLLGSTGSIGTQALDDVDGADGRFTVVALAAGGSNPDLLAQQAVRTRAEAVGVARGSESELRRLIEEAAAAAGANGYSPQILAGDEAAAKLAAWPEADVVLNGMTGSIGLALTIAALQAGHTLALANKESLIVGGELVTSLARPGQIVPVDSEHSALAQCLRSGAADEVERLVITASGGPFRGRDRAELAGVTPEQALAHPTWNMGPMVTTSSATLVNKGLEVIEAHLLFDIDLDRIEAVVHPQSVIHSMVEFIDGSTIAQASPPDMRLPIALGMAWLERVRAAASPCDWSQSASWTFEPLDNKAFPAVELAKEAARRGSTYPAVYNAANEEAVGAFHAGDIGFLDIVDTIAHVLDEHVPAGPMSLNMVLAAENWARNRAQNRLGTTTILRAPGSAGGE